MRVQQGQPVFAREVVAGSGVKLAAFWEVEIATTAARSSSSTPLTTEADMADWERDTTLCNDHYSRPSFHMLYI